MPMPFESQRESPPISVIEQSCQNFTKIGFLDVFGIVAIIALFPAAPMQTARLGSMIGGGRLASIALANILKKHFEDTPFRNEEERLEKYAKAVCTYAFIAGLLFSAAFSAILEKRLAQKEAAQSAIVKIAGNENQRSIAS